VNEQLKTEIITVSFKLLIIYVFVHNIIENVNAMCNLIEMLIIILCGDLVQF